MPFGPCTIKGGLPVIAEVSFTRDYWGEDDASVEALYWCKRDGSRGAKVSQKVFDEALSDMCAECDIIEAVSDHLAHEQWLAEHPDGEPEMFEFS